MSQRPRLLPLLLTAFTLTALTACDLGEPLDLDTLELEDINELDEVDEIETTPAASVPAAGGVLAPSQGENQTVTQLLSWTSYPSIDSIVDGDIVQINNRQKGFVGCPDLATVSATTAPPSNAAGYVWLVHEVDLDNDGQSERQFEALDSAGDPTSLFLKMEDDDNLECSVITGIGDAAAWTGSGSLTATVSGWVRSYARLRSFKHNRCVQFSDSSAPVGDTCSGGAYRAFSFQVLN